MNKAWNERRPYRNSAAVANVFFHAVFFFKRKNFKRFPSSKLMLWTAFFIDFAAQSLFIGTRCLLMVFLINSCTEADNSSFTLLVLGLCVMLNHTLLYQFVRVFVKKFIDKMKRKKKIKNEEESLVFSTKNRNSLLNKIDQKVVAFWNKIYEDFQSNKHIAAKTFNLFDNQVIVEELEYLPVYSLMVHDITANLWLLLTNYGLFYLEFYLIANNSAYWYTEKIIDIFGVPMYLPDSYCLLNINVILSVVVILLYEVHVLYENE